ncbi:type II secretion system F family protein [Arthrobacter sp. ATA002]|uniref:type II secretion system F family protein n=1 Tax=Arthrobacter sp. ATA002 TaxID=2991715 RepID=UPI0022A72C25|nr:type II secretion system F family protein [Arthrobacter sp. ATA002]WAP52356.1 type II secretion system F family protein [Arthrobacter sp. ATA002]
MVQSTGAPGRGPLMAGTLVAVFLAAAAALLLRGPGLSAAPGTGSGVPGLGAGSGRGLGAGVPGANGPGSAGISDPALLLDLVAAMLDAGQSLLPALGILADVAEPETALCLRRVQAALELGAPWAVAWELAVPGAAGASSSGPPIAGGPGSSRQQSSRRQSSRRQGDLPHPYLRLPAAAAELRGALTFTATTGAPSAAVLVAAAAQLRRRRAREAERRAAALGVKLVVPLGLCALPAFIVLTVVPLLLSLLPSFP